MRRALSESRRQDLIDSILMYNEEYADNVGISFIGPTQEELESLSDAELEQELVFAKSSYEGSSASSDMEDDVDDFMPALDQEPVHSSEDHPADNLPSKMGMGRRHEGLQELPESVLKIIVAEGAALKSAGLLEGFELNYDAIEEAIHEEALFEGLRDDVMLPRRELLDLIAAMDPEEIASGEYVDEDTGEVLLARGQKAGSSYVHPDYKHVKRPSRYMDDEPDYEGVEPTGNVQNQYQTAIEMFAADFEGEKFDDPEGAAMDAADSFFVLNPEWKMWGPALGLTKADMKSQVAELIYSNLMGEGLQLEVSQEGPWICRGCGDEKMDHPMGEKCRHCDMDYVPVSDLPSDERREIFGEAEYKGRDVPLGKPMKGDTAKFKVYVKDKKTGNVKKVNFGSKGMEIRRDNPKARKSFRARHGCGTKRASDRTKAAYWSCRMWSTKPVSKIVGGK